MPLAGMQEGDEGLEELENEALQEVGASAGVVGLQSAMQQVHTRRKSCDAIVFGCWVTIHGGWVLADPWDRAGLDSCPSPVASRRAWRERGGRCRSGAHQGHQAKLGAGRYPGGCAAGGKRIARPAP